MKRIVLLLCCLICFDALFAGIYRHDKPESDYAALANEKQFDCVGQLFWKEEKHGSCVLVGNKYVLSAAHCFTEALTKPDTFYNGKTRTIVNQPYGEYVRDITQYYILLKGRKYKGKTAHIYPVYLDHNMKHKCDIALIELEEIVTDIEPAIICRSFDEMNSNIIGVGYGIHGIADQPENIDANGLRLAGENVIDSFCGYKVNGHYVSMLCDFDHPTNNKCNKMGSSIPRPLEYITGAGDSGGGAFRKTQRGWELIGICGGSEHGGVDVSLLVTKGIGYYGQLMEWQRISVFADWIDQNTK